MRVLWSQAPPAAPRGLALAREKNLVLVWDEAQTLSLYHLLGHPQARRQLPGAVACACAADDGSAFAAGGTAGELWWLAPDLTTLWQQRLPFPLVAVALDPHGNYLAAADEHSRVWLYTRPGQRIGKVTCVRPLRYLAFAPGLPVVFGSADFGLVGSFDLAGQWRWRDGLVAHVGGLAVRGTDGQVVLSCYSGGLQRYDADGRNLGSRAVAESCQLAALNYDGTRTLVAGPARLLLLGEQGQALQTFDSGKAVVGAALGALGEHAVVAQAGGPVIGLDVRGAQRV
jgi:hypothetical protein